MEDKEEEKEKIFSQKKNEGKFESQGVTVFLFLSLTYERERVKLLCSLIFFFLL